MDTPASTYPEPEEKDRGDNVRFTPVELSPSLPPPRVAQSDFDASLMRDSYSATAAAEVFDRSFHASLARYTAGISPAALTTAFLDWAIHLGLSPGKQFELNQKAFRKLARFNRYLASQAMVPGCRDRCIEPLHQDHRFSSEAWQEWPFNVIYQSFLLQQQWWHNATCGVRGVDPRHARVVEFTTRQILDTLSPSNFLFTNPELLQATREQMGLNLIRGTMNFMEDATEALGGMPPRHSLTHAVGKDVATTPGKVVYRNDLIELIHYTPRTPQVHCEPVLIVPAWIMKYYILDLSPHNSMVGHLLDQGFDVFIISWRNPGPEHRDFGFDDYRRLGPMKALDIIGEVTGVTNVHAAGYCLGGTLLAITAAAMARDGDDRLNSVTLLAAQTDFSSPGELGLFIDHSQLAFLEDMMWEQGFLDSHQMAGAFQLLRSNDLVWSRMVREYLLGREENGNDLMSWNADATRMPYRMHAEYLRQLFLDNDLAEGRFRVADMAISISDIRAPIFAVSTSRDHVSPWQSVYRIHQLADTSVTFVLTEGGHNGGIVSEPGHPHRKFQIATRAPDDNFIEADTWSATIPLQDGSWWVAWSGWLAGRSTGQRSALPGSGAPSGMPLPAPVCDAPGTYVLER
ncbi:MAG: alpha/beta fold hydrolase [Alphaproteobacteria bacterium]|nr:alpha/beta fold hydrolase [Alphaproteobacteria bacterium]